jgi:UDPglucose 6-dehydrogenase
MKISFIGLGKLGMPCAEVIAQKGHIVTGYDIARRGNSDVLQFPTIQSAINGVDIVFIAVPTPHDPDYDGRAPTAHLEPKDFHYLY